MRLDWTQVGDCAYDRLVTACRRGGGQTGNYGFDRQHAYLHHMGGHDMCETAPEQNRYFK